MSNEKNEQHLSEVEVEAETEMETLEENRKAAITLAKQARMSLDILTPDLEATIYNNAEFERAVFDLVRRHRSTRIRILCRDCAEAVQQGHCLVRLAQTLTSAISLHRLTEEYRHEQRSFLVADRRGVLYRLQAGSRNAQAVFSLNAPQRAAGLLDFFDDAWEHSEPDTQTRRLYV